MDVGTALLEDWMRRYYFDTSIDIGSSGVASYSLGELRRLLNIAPEELDHIVFNDGYSLGSPALRTCVAQRWSNGDADRVMVTHGSSEAIYLLMKVLLEPGDEVLVLDPCYQQLSSTAHFMGCRITHWPLRFEQEFVPDLDEARSLMRAGTRMIVVNFPHNPTGTTITPAQQVELLRLAAEAGAYLVWDGAFSDLVYDCAPLPDPSLRYDRCISIGTLSKAYGLPGLRVGWCLAGHDVLQRCVRLRDYITLHLSPLVETIATRAIERGDSLLAGRLEMARRNLGLLENWVRRHEPVVQWVRPQGGVCALLQLNRVADVTAFCQDLANRHGVLLVPGICFNRPGSVRLGFGGPTAAFEDGLSRLSAALGCSSTRQRAAAEHVSLVASEGRA